jgi:hypothetical protein
MPDINQTKTKIDALHKKLTQISGEVSRAKTELESNKSLSKMMITLGEQNLLIAEQNAQLDRNIKGAK